jgi:hypothetical protein
LEFRESTPAWWESLQRLEPFGQGFEIPAFELRGVEVVQPLSKRSPTRVILKQGTFSWPGEFRTPTNQRPERLVVIPQATPKEDHPFKWMIQPASAKAAAGKPAIISQAVTA